jgi:exosortase family protein XrtF
MNLLAEIKQSYTAIPRPVLQFLKRALLIFVIWKIIYHVFLFNARVIDAPLTHITSQSTAKVLAWIYPHNQLAVYEECKPLPTNPKELVCMDFITMNSKKVVGIADACNALELYVLYIAFLICYPSSFKRIVLFSLSGMAIIYIANIARCAGLAVMNIHQNKLTDIAHHYVFKTIVYALIFVLWVMYTKKIEWNEKD